MLRHGAGGLAAWVPVAACRLQHPGMEGRAESRARNPAQLKLCFLRLWCSGGRPLACAQDRLLGPCYKTGPEGTSILSLPIDSPVAPCGKTTRCPGESITRPTANTTCSKPHLAAQAFRTERRYCGASYQHQGATVGRPCVSRRESCFVMDRSVLLASASRQVPCGALVRSTPQVNVSASDNRVQRA